MYYFAADGTRLDNSQAGSAKGWYYVWTWRFTSEVPPKTIVKNQMGWDSGAVSIPVVNGNGGYEFSVPNTVAGVVVGITDNYSGSGYLSIAHGLHFSRGDVEVIQRGQKGEALGHYSATDKFRIVRVGDNVAVYKNGVLKTTLRNLVAKEFYLASCQYLEGDAVVGAKVIDAGWAVSGPSSTVGPISALGMGGYSAFGDSTIGPLSAVGGAYAKGFADSTIGPIAAMAGDHPVGAASSGFGPLASFGDGGLMEVVWGVGSSALAPLVSNASMLTGTTGQGNGTLRKILARASDRSMGEGVADLDGVQALGLQALPIEPWVLFHGGGYSINGSGSRATNNGLDASLPALKLNAYFGSQWKLKAPKLKLQASGTVTTNWPFQLTGPALTLAGAGTVSGVIEFNLTYGGKPSVQAQFGAQAKLATKGGYALEGHGLVGSAGAGQLKLKGHYTLDAVGTVRELTVWSLTGPALTAAPTGQAWLVGPSLKLVAAGGEVVAATYEAYAINIATGAVSHYTNFDFDNVLRFGNRFIGVRTDGLYELAGNTDNGEAILSTIKTFRTDFGKSNRKRVPWVYLFGRAGENLQVSVQADESVPSSYPVTRVAPARADGTGAVRATIGRGVKGIYYEFTLANPCGGDFEIDRVEVVTDVTSRAI